MAKIIGEDIIDVLYHGTCRENADKLLAEGWKPNQVSVGGNVGQTRYLYLTTGPEDAMWFAEEKGCDVVLEVRNVGIEFLAVDPEDGVSATVEEELALQETIHLPGRVVLISRLSSDHFRIHGKTASLKAKTAWQEIELSEKEGDELKGNLLGGILKSNDELEAWADNEDLPPRRTAQRHKFMRLFMDKKIAVIDDMRVFDRNKGWGKKIIQQFIDKAKAAGCDAIILQAGIFEDQEKGFDLVKWYERLGFTTRGYSAELPLMVKWLKTPSGKKAADPKKPSKNATVMILMPHELAWKMLKAAEHFIAEEDLAGDGFEDEPHITIKYGVEETLDALIGLVHSQPAFEVTLGKTHVFEPGKSSDDAAPVVIELNAPELKKLHEQVGEVMGNRKDDFEYKAHATLAYVKPAAAKKYDGLDFLEGVSFMAENITLSRKDRIQNTVEFGLAHKTASQQKTHSLTLTADAISNFPPFVVVRYPQKGMRWRSILKIVKQIAGEVAGQRVPWRSINIFKSPWQNKEEQDAAFTTPSGKPMFDIQDDGGFFPAGMQPQPKVAEKIHYMDEGRSEDFECICGNNPNSSGFFPCDRNGKEVEPSPGQWDGLRWRCEACGRIINGKTLEVLDLAPRSMFDEPMKMSSDQQWDKVKEFKNGKVLFYKGTVTIQVKPDKGDYSVEVWLWDKQGTMPSGTPGHAHVTHYPKKFEGYDPDVSRIGYTMPTDDHSVIIPEAVWKDPSYPMHKVPFTRAQKEEAALKELTHHLSTKTGSHNSTPLSDTEYPEFEMNDAGQETNAYADMPEKVQGDEKVPTLEELAPDLFEKAAAARIRAFHGCDSTEPPNHDAIYFAQYPEDAKDYGPNVFPAILTPGKILKPNAPYAELHRLLQPMLLGNKGMDVKDFVGTQGIHYTYLGDYPEVLENMRRAGYDAVYVDEPMSMDVRSILVLNPAVIDWQKQVKVGAFAEAQNSVQHYQPPHGLYKVLKSDPFWEEWELFGPDGLYKQEQK